MEKIELARAAFIKAAHDTANDELGCFINDDGNGEFTIDGVFNLDAALLAAIEAVTNPKK